MGYVFIAAILIGVIATRYMAGPEYPKPGCVEAFGYAVCVGEGE